MQSIPLKLILVYIYIILFSASNALCSQLNNLRCPIEPTELATPKFNSEYNGDIIYFCCSECVSLFEESPEIYSKSIQEIKSNKDLETEKTFQLRQNMIINEDFDAERGDTLIHSGAKPVGKVYGISLFRMYNVDQNKMMICSGHDLR